MQPLINEWQLGNKLNQALQQQQRADFSLWLALLSPAVEEMAAFETPASESKKSAMDYYQALGINKSRGYSWQQQDGALLHKQSLAAHCSLVQLKLQSYLNPEPWVLQEDSRKLDSPLIADLDPHCRRRLAGTTIEQQSRDETALFEILEELAEQPPFFAA